MSLLPKQMLRVPTQLHLQILQSDDAERATEAERRDTGNHLRRRTQQCPVGNEPKRQLLAADQHLRDTSQSAHDDHLQDRLFVILHPTPVEKRKAARVTSIWHPKH
ncbi:hypothetical protein [Burkholderia ubonensis]|uniref:hypothetical protein n=1 Tax=Burkholderia ubonensis TaxID=101571 RepID=UPI0012F95A37|nr:hypothetical protein [Burkholderia ubonensis]